MSDQICPSCGSEEVTSKADHYKFQYGGPYTSIDEVTLSAFYTVHQCENEECQLGWSGEDAEDARERAVNLFLTRETTDRFNNIAKKYRLLSVGEAEAIYWEHQTVPMCKMLKKMNELQQDLDQCKELLAETLQRSEVAVLAERDKICAWLEYQAKLPGGVPGATINRIAHALRTGEHLRERKKDGSNAGAIEGAVADS